MTIEIRNELTMDVTKTVKKGTGNVREPVGQVVLYAPALADFGLQAEPTAQAATGELTYADPKVQWLYQALLAAVKANARNKLQTGSTALKPNTKLPVTLEELITPAESNSTVLAERRAIFDMFKGYLADLAKPDNVKKLLLTFLEKPDTLGLQPAEQRAKIKVYFEEFGSKVEESLTEWQADYLLNTIAQCDAEEVAF